MVDSYLNVFYVFYSILMDIYYIYYLEHSLVTQNLLVRTRTELDSDKLELRHYNYITKFTLD